MVYVLILNGKLCWETRHFTWKKTSRVNETWYLCELMWLWKEYLNVFFFVSCLGLNWSSTWFERISMLVILLNCITLGMFQPCQDLECHSDRCSILQVTQHAHMVRLTKVPILCFSVIQSTWQMDLLSLKWKNRLWTGYITNLHNARLCLYWTTSTLTRPQTPDVAETSLVHVVDMSVLQKQNHFFQWMRTWTPFETVKPTPLLLFIHCVSSWAEMGVWFPTRAVSCN